MKAVFVFALALLVLGTVQVEAAEICPTVSALTSFNATKYLGRWYEVKRVTESWESGGDCTTATYTLAADGTTVIVYNRQYLSSYGKYYSLTGNATFVGDSDVAKLYVRFPVTSVVANYWVLDTDYEHYSVVWSCSNDTTSSSNATASVTIWILSRTPTLSNEYLEVVDEVLRTAEVNTSTLATTSQSDCPHVSCDGCSVSVSDLDVDKVSGEWYEVKHLNDSIGASTLTCSKTQVSTFDDGLVLVKSAWNASANATKQTFDAATWENSTSKAAVFKMTGDTVEGGNFAEFCVLGTDYTGYAVISQCIEHGYEDLDTDEINTGGVWVWSRTESLNSTQLTEVKKILVSAYYNTSSLEDTASTPCS